MRYKIEFLTDALNETSVCKERFAYTRDLEIAKRQALEHLPKVRHQFGARCFQIRDVWDGGRIVATISIDP